jgi:hypothetical protein
MFLTVCNLILSPHPLGRYILDEARDQPIPGSFLKTLSLRSWRSWRASVGEEQAHSDVSPARV